MTVSHRTSLQIAEVGSGELVMLSRLCGTSAFSLTNREQLPDAPQIGAITRFGDMTYAICVVDKREHVLAIQE